MARRLTVEKQSFRGVWWVPGSDRKVAGILDYSPEDGAQLNLVGSMEEGDWPHEPPGQTTRSYPVILGRASEAPRLTLEACREVSLRSGAQVFQTLRAERTYVGAHLQAPDEFRFPVAGVGIRHLAEWTGVTGLRSEWGDPSSGDEFDYRINYRKPEDVCAPVPGATVCLAFSPETASARHREILEERVAFRIDAERPLHSDEWADLYVKPLKDLLALSTDRPCPMESFSLFRPDLDGGSGTLVHVLAQPPDSSRADAARPLLPTEVMFMLPPVRDRFDPFLGSWFALRGRLGFAGDMYFSTVFGRQLYLENYFWNIAQAAELSHRYLYGGGVIPADEFRAVRDRISEAVPESRYEFVRTRLSYANEPSFHDRLLDLVRRAGDAVDRLIPDAGAFVRKVKNTRNYLTHGDERLKRKTASDEELYYLSNKLGFVLLVNYLQWLDFGPDEIAAMVQRNRRFVHLLTQ
jgi:ApeA-like protein/HEPN superfamily Apea-like protein